MEGIAPHNDSHLIAGCINRDLECWSALIKKYSKLINISIIKRLKKYGVTVSDHEVQDIRQNILALLWSGNKLESVKNRDNISYWLSVVSGNMAIEHVRKNVANRTHKTISIFEEINEKELIEMLPSPTPAPSAEASRNETMARIKHAVDSLSAKESIIIKLNLFHGKKYNEISEILRLPSGTISSYIKRAKEKLKADLSDLR